MHPKYINQLNRLITSLVYTIYPVVLATLLLTRDERFWRALLAPAVSFVLVSIFRNVYNAPRPYEVSGVKPIIKKESKGKSFPSRHVFSIFVIATVLFFIYKPLGLVLMVAGLVLAVLRVIGGGHFPRDVIVGAIVGILSGVLGFYI